MFSVEVYYNVYHLKKQQSRQRNVTENIQKRSSNNRNGAKYSESENRYIKLKKFYDSQLSIYIVQCNLLVLKELFLSCIRQTT